MAATSRSSSGEITARNSVGKRPWALAGGLLILALLILALLLRRWVHHAQLELVPVIVPPNVSSDEVLHPSARAIVARMAADVQTTLSPPQRPRYAVLTFDDGPYPVMTPALARTLEGLHVHADFFFIGRDAIEQPAIARRAAAGGVEIGNHTLSHPEMNTLLFPAQLEEVVDGALAIKRSTGRDVAYLRPPHGNFDAQTIEAARAHREIVALWDVDPGDWRQVTPAFIVENVTRHAKSPAVILLHNGSAATIEALPSIVQAYRRAGFEFVTLSELQRRLPLDQINDPIPIRIPS
jgi:peptidoglycan/xylan/chitin deacetylase (PgdA/CDA1 family)